MTISRRNFLKGSGLAAGSDGEWPLQEVAAIEAKGARVVVRPNAVFTPSAENEKLRPSQATGAPGLFLAGDWTQTGWPATMEGAVRSGNGAAEAILERRF